jgi:hypothetical protein
MVVEVVEVLRETDKRFELQEKWELNGRQMTRELMEEVVMTAKVALSCHEINKLMDGLLWWNE